MPRHLPLRASEMTYGGRQEGGIPLTVDSVGVMDCPSVAVLYAEDTPRSKARKASLVARREPHRRSLNRGGAPSMTTLGRAERGLFHRSPHPARLGPNGGQ